MIKDIKAHVEEYGMDTVFKLPHSCLMTQEHYLLEQWGICDYRDFIKDWMDE